MYIQDGFKTLLQPLQNTIWVPGHKIWPAIKVGNTGNVCIM